jgi:hypothetical protein
MCQIFDIVYHFCGFCGSMLERINNCPEEAFACLYGDLCLHISNRITEQESLDLFCPTCFHVSGLRKKYQEGKLTLEGMEKMITNILKALVKVPVTSPPGEETFGDICWRKASTQ